jgi:DNA polymerase-3 subunit delta
MADTAPVVYILHGEDEYAIAAYLEGMESKLGDAGMATMNTTRLDGNTSNFEQVITAASAMPFLARRRLVIFTHPLARLSQKPAQEKFLAAIEKLPSTTALALVEYRLLTSENERKRKKINWLEAWAVEHTGYAYLKPFPLPKGAEMIPRLQEMARKEKGQIAPEAASLLATLVDGDPRMADQEIQKLLAYVNYQRTIEVDDVQAITADANQGNIFILVDALANRDGRKAMGMLQRLLEYQDYYAVFGMVVRQFRQLLVTRDMIERGEGKADVMREVRVGPYAADKLLTQARRFQTSDLEGIYHRLLEVDEAVKTSQMPDSLALETFVAAFTSEREAHG